MRTRITSLFTLVTLLWMSVAFAAPTKLSQQGRLLDGDGTPLSDGHGMTFSLHDAETDGNEVWREERVVQFEEGYYSIVLGELVPLDDLLFASSTVWLQLAIDGAALSPRQEVVSVPYALRAAVAESVEGSTVDANEVSIGGNVVIDGSGNWLGTPPDWSDLTGVPADLSDGDADTLLGLPCADGFVAKYSTALGAWDCAEDRDSLAGLLCLTGDTPVFDAVSGLWNCGPDLDTDTQLTEGQVDTFVANNGYSVGAHTVDTDTQLTEAQVDTFVANNGYSSGLDISGLQAQITVLDTSIAAIESNLSTATVALQTQIALQAQTIATLDGDTSILKNYIETLENNLALLAFYRASDHSISKFNMVDQTIDEYVDATGIDAANSTNEALGSGYYWGAPIGPDPYLKLLSHYDGSGQSAIDESSSGHTAVFSGSVTQSAGQEKFGGASLYSPGGNGVGWHQWTGTVSDFDTGDGSDWTIDFWIYWNGFNTHNDTVQTRCGIGDNQIAIGVIDSATRRIYLSNGTVIETTAGVSTGQWYHYEFSRESTGGGNYVIRLFVDGELMVSAPTAVVPNCGVDSVHLMSNPNLHHYSPDAYIDELRFSKGIARHTSNFTPPTAAHTVSSPVTGDLTLQSVATEAETQPDLADLVVLIEDGAGTATINTDIKAYVSRNDGADWVQATLVDEGDWKLDRRILVAHDVDISGQASDKTMRYKITTHNQSASLETRIHATSLAWSL